MSSTFTPDDVRLLEKTLSIREQILDNFIEAKGLPVDARGMESMTMLLDSTDKQIFTKAKINLDNSANKVNEETKGILTDLLLSLHKGERPQLLSETMDTVEPPSYVPNNMELHEGETIPRVDHINLEDITQ